MRCINILSENIAYLSLSGNVFNLYHFIFNQASDKVMFDMQVVNAELDFLRN